MKTANDHTNPAIHSQLKTLDPVSDLIAQCERLKICRPKGIRWLPNAVNRRIPPRKAHRFQAAPLYASYKRLIWHQDLQANLLDANIYGTPDPCPKKRFYILQVVMEDR